MHAAKGGGSKAQSSSTATLLDSSNGPASVSLEGAYLAWDCDGEVEMLVQAAAARRSTAAILEEAEWAARHVKAAWLKNTSITTSKL